VEKRLYQFAIRCLKLKDVALLFTRLELCHSSPIEINLVLNIAFPLAGFETEFQGSYVNFSRGSSTVKMLPLPGSLRTLIDMRKKTRQVMFEYIEMTLRHAPDVTTLKLPRSGTMAESLAQDRSKSVT
jgi:hypothetical protein